MEWTKIIIGAPLLCTECSSLKHARHNHVSREGMYKGHQRTHASSLIYFDLSHHPALQDCPNCFSLPFCPFPSMEALRVPQQSGMCPAQSSTVFLREHLVWFLPTLSCWETGKTVERLMKCAQKSLTSLVSWTNLPQKATSHNYVKLELGSQ